MLSFLFGGIAEYQWEKDGVIERRIGLYYALLLMCVSPGQPKFDPFGSFKG
jgi:hypothetical protein